MNSFIYTISDPRDGQIKYVGKTIQGTKRFKKHLDNCSLKDNTPKNNWIKDLKKQKLNPIFDIIQYEENEIELSELEVFYISYFKFLGFKLKNVTDGGEGHSGVKKTKETIEKLRKNYRCKKVVHLNTKEIF